MNLSWQNAKEYLIKLNILLKQKVIDHSMMIRTLKVGIDLDSDSPLAKTILMCNLVMLIRSPFHDENKYHPKVFLEECVCKVAK